MSEIFDNKYARYYDIIYQDKNYPAEADFILRIMNRFCPSGKTVLDVACGTGNHLFCLEDKGLSVHGLDVSPAMINIAQAKAKEKDSNITFGTGFMQCLDVGKKFDSILCLFSSINYLILYDDIKETFLRVSQHLNPGGLFVFDFWNGTAVTKNYSPIKFKWMTSHDLKILRTSETKIDEIEQKALIEMKFLIFERDCVIDETQEKHHLRYYFINEMKNYLSMAGLRLEHICPFMNIDGKITRDTWNVTFVTKLK
ncbi:MAG: class I SAM-dependent methyltransferase [Pseudomonadota bacterium]